MFAIWVEAPVEHEELEERSAAATKVSLATDARLLAPLQDRLVFFPQLVPRQVRLVSQTHKLDQVLFHAHRARDPTPSRYARLAAPFRVAALWCP